MTPADIAKARAVCEAATPGPWEQAGTTENPCPVVSSRHRDGYQIHSRLGERDQQHWPFMVEQYNRDAAFIAAARTYLPAALDALTEKDAELERSRAREAQVEKELAEAVGLLRDFIATEGAPDTLPVWMDRLRRAAMTASEFVSRFDEEGS